MQKVTIVFLLAVLCAFATPAPAQNNLDDINELPQIPGDAPSTSGGVWNENNLVSPEVETGTEEESDSGDKEIGSEEIGKMLDDLYGEDKKEETPVEVEAVHPAPTKEIKEQKNYKTQIFPSKIYKKRYNPRNRHLPKARTIQDFDRYIFSASASDNINGLRALLDEGINPNTKNASGNTPLMAAALTGSLNTARLLLIKGAGVNIQNDLGLTALHIAASKGGNRVVKTLINAGAEVDLQDEHGNTALMSAALSGNLNAAQSLIDGGADTDIQNSAGMTALHIASYKGHSSVIQALLIADANPNIKDNNNATAEELAIMRGNRMAARVLQGAGPRRDSRAYSRFLLGNIDNEDGNKEGWYVNASEKMRYALLPEKEQEKWDNLLAAWVDADSKFDLLTDGEKYEWNIKRKILQNVFREYFIADSAEGQEALDEYMSRWEGNIITTADEMEEVVEDPEEESSVEEDSEAEIDREKRKLLEQLKKIEADIPSVKDYNDVEEEYNKKFNAKEKLPDELPEEESEEPASLEEDTVEKITKELPAEEVSEPESEKAVDEGTKEDVDEEKIWEDQLDDDGEQLPEVDW